MLLDQGVEIYVLTNPPAPSTLLSCDFVFPFLFLFFLLGNETRGACLTITETEKNYRWGGWGGVVMQTCDEGEGGDWRIMIRLELSFYVPVLSEVVPSVVAAWSITRGGGVLCWIFL